MRILYFDIDGVLFDYDDRPKPALVGGRLRSLLDEFGFERLVCVSGWSDMVQTPVLRIPPEHHAVAIAQHVAPVFEDPAWLLPRLVLTTDTDHRCRHIDRSQDWFYVDDWADHFFIGQFGEESYAAELGRRICMPNPRGDGSDIVEWLGRLRTPRSD